MKKQEAIAFPKLRRFMFRVTALIILVLLIYMFLVLQDAFIKGRQKANMTQAVTLKPDNQSIPTYNVDGLTEDEIDALIEEGRK